jgi:hypothetical protein
MLCTSGARRGARGAGAGLFLAKNATVLPNGQKSRRSEPRHLGSYNFKERGFDLLSAPNAEVWVQVFGFSPVITIFHVFSPIFHPIFQLQGIGFSSVRKNNRV